MDAHYAIDAYVNFLKAIGWGTILILSIGIALSLRGLSKKLGEPSTRDERDSSDEEQ